MQAELLPRTQTIDYVVLMPPMKRSFRAFTFVFATLQLLAFATAPVLEGLSASHQAAATSATVGHPDNGSAPAGHRPDICPACQMMGLSARLADLTPPALPPALQKAVPATALTFAPQSNASHGFLSRAPPALPG